MTRLAVGAVVTALACALLVASAATASAAGIDPTPNDVLLGKQGGLAYVEDAETAAVPGSTDSLAACPDVGGRWQLVGGGISLGFPFDAVGASRPVDLDVADRDKLPDDYWQATSFLLPAHTIRSYAICARHPHARYRSRPVPHSSTTRRNGKASCPRKTMPSAGGGFVAEPGGYLGSLFPIGSRNWEVAAIDPSGGTGLVSAEVICLRGRKTKTYEKKLALADGDFGTATARCPPSRHVTGGGVRIPHPGPSAISSSYPADGKDGDPVPDDGWSSTAINDSNQQATATFYAFCRKG